MEDISLTTILIVGALAAIFLLVTRRRNESFLSSSKKGNQRRQSRGANWDIGNVVGESFSSGRFGEFEGAKKLK